MKKIIFLFITLSFFLISEAQITNKIMGLTLGATTEFQVKTFLKNKHYKITEQHDDCFFCNGLDFKFGGYQWTGLSFFFFEKKLMSIGISSYEFYYPKETFDNLVASLKDKYSPFFINEELSDPNNKWSLFSDGKTSLRVYYVKGKYNATHIGISYTNVSLAEKSVIRDKNEL